MIKKEDEMWMKILDKDNYTRNEVIEIIKAVLEGSCDGFDRAIKTRKA